VFAGCLNEASLEQFQLEPRIIPIKMDVTSDGDVQAVVERVNKWLNNNEEGGKAEDRSPRKKRYLHALVNNAGLAVTGLIDWLDMASFEKQMQGKQNHRSVL
jgi:NAD(P)-dependent dehydrogenase (short-subunit alcohol dehydrogenase family)